MAFTKLNILVAAAAVACVAHAASAAQPTLRAPQPPDTIKLESELEFDDSTLEIDGESASRRQVEVDVELDAVTEPEELPTVEAEPVRQRVPTEPMSDIAPVEEYHPGLFERFGLSHKGHADKAKRPMVRESWLNQPFSFSWFAGGYRMSDPIQDHVTGHTGFFTGFRLGGDFSDHTGGEARFGFTRSGLSDPTGVVELGDIKAFVFDVQGLYYPWGNTRFRPFLAVGLGFTDLDFVDDRGRAIHDLVFSMPFGAGIKYRWDAHLAFRAELLDNVAYASGDADVMHNVSFTAGLEYRFGAKSRRSYWPWNPSRSWW